MKECTEVTLGAEGRKYVKECLEAGNTLSRFLLNAVDLTRGDTRTFLPGDTPRSEIFEFRRGGKLPVPPKSEWWDLNSAVAVPVRGTDSCLVAEIEAFLRRNEQRLCIFENALAKPTDYALSRMKSKLAIFDDEVYHLLTSADADSSRILETIREAFSLPTFIGVLTSMSENADRKFVENGQLTSCTLNDIANFADKILTGAYDGEGYVIWDLT